MSTCYKVSHMVLLESSRGELETNEEKVGKTWLYLAPNKVSVKCQETYIGTGYESQLEPKAPLNSCTSDTQVRRRSVNSSALLPLVLCQPPSGKPRNENVKMETLIVGSRGNLHLMPHDVSRTWTGRGMWSCDRGGRAHTSQLWPGSNKVSDK